MRRFVLPAWQRLILATRRDFGDSAQKSIIAAGGIE
jgi:hypothetical protein